MQYNLKIIRILSNYADQMLINILYLQSMLQIMWTYYDAPNKSKQ
jgi:hypothetical protein